MNREELEALYGQSSFAFKLYFCGIRRFMDYSTGIVGRKRKISYQSLREAMYVIPHSGITDSGCPHRSKIRRALASLKKIGLLEEISAGEYLVFKCLKAKQDESAQKQLDPNPTHQVVQEADTVDMAYFPVPMRAVSLPPIQPDTQPDTAKRAQPDTPPLSVINNESNINNICRFPIATASSFEEFWKHYPRKENKKKSAEIWKRKLLDRIGAKIIEDIIERSQKHSSWLKGYIPHATTYLNGERWEDEIISEEVHAIDQQNARPKKHTEIFAEFMREERAKEGRTFDGN